VDQAQLDLPHADAGEHHRYGIYVLFKEAEIIKAIGIFGITLVPGVAVAWPDNTVAQINNISDFVSDQVLTKDGADIMVAFVPIDCFLTQGMREVFLESPALFFNPFAMLFDDSAIDAFRANRARCHQERRGAEAALGAPGFSTCR
jgi:hypothetical protein